MAKGTERFYRSQHRTQDWVTFQVRHRETDLWIRAERDLQQVARDRVLSCRLQLDDHIIRHPAFLHSLQPLPDDPQAVPLVRRMLRAGHVAGVGPMAAVAGAIAEDVAAALRAHGSDAIVENGGDCYLDVHEPVTVAVYAGERSPFTQRIALSFPAARFPLAICTSSGTIGHSLSFGKADAVTVVARDGALADAVATRLGNAVRTTEDVGFTLDLAARIPGIDGVLILIHDHLGAWGNLELVRFDNGR
jgi:hypothetical protein